MYVFECAYVFVVLPCMSVVAVFVVTLLCLYFCCALYLFCAIHTSLLYALLPLHIALHSSDSYTDLTPTKAVSLIPLCLCSAHFHSSVGLVSHTNLALLPLAPPTLSVIVLSSPLLFHTFPIHIHSYHFIYVYTFLHIFFAFLLCVLPFLLCHIFTHCFTLCYLVGITLILKQHMPQRHS